MFVYFVEDFTNNTYILICMYRPDSYCKAVICASMFSIPGEPLWLGLHTELMRAVGDRIYQQTIQGSSLLIIFPPMSTSSKTYFNGHSIPWHR